jgi:hypothetical protein
MQMILAFLDFLVQTKVLKRILIYYYLVLTSQYGSPWLFEQLLGLQLSL